MPIKHHTIRTFSIRALFVLFMVAALTVAALFLSNLFLPDSTDQPDMLRDTDMTIATEALRVKQHYGDRIWPGFGALGEGVLLFNDQYAFLIETNDPADGFLSPPRMEPQGTAWEYVSGDASGEAYYRQPVDRPDLAIGQFTVRIGDSWVPSYYTRGESIVSLRKLIEESLPGPLAAIVPYRLLPVIWNTDWYIMGLVHEFYHAFVGNSVPGRLLAAEGAVALMDSGYPYDDPKSESSWKRELEYWSLAIGSTTDTEAATYVRQAIGERDTRRTQGAYADDLVQAVKDREWQEGLAKYTELKMWELVAKDPDYQPVAAMGNVPHFKLYRTYENRRAEEMRMLKRQYSHHGDTRYYYSGMAQAILLDRLLPEWKDRVFDEGVYLEDLLRGALQNRK